MKDQNTFVKLKDQERQVRKDIIINAAERIIKSKPFNKVSMRDIAMEAGISPASIYRYFPDQQTLFIEAFLRGLRGIVSDLARLINKKKDMSIEEISDRFIDFLTENDHYIGMLTNFAVFGSMKPELSDKMTQMTDSLLEQFDNIFKNLEAKGHVRFLSHAFFASLNGVLITFRDYPVGRSKGTVLKHMKFVGRVIAAIFKNGIYSDELSSINPKDAFQKSK